MGPRDPSTPVFVVVEVSGVDFFMHPMQIIEENDLSIPVCEFLELRALTRFYPETRRA